MLEQLADTRREHDELLEARVRWQKCVEKLGGTERRLIQQRYGSEHTFAELAKQTGRTPNAVYMSMWRIRRALFDCVSEGLAPKDGVNQMPRADHADLLISLAFAVCDGRATEEQVGQLDGLLDGDRQPGCSIWNALTCTPSLEYRGRRFGLDRRIVAAAGTHAAGTLGPAAWRNVILGVAKRT